MGYFGQLISQKTFSQKSHARIDLRGLMRVLYLTSEVTKHCCATLISLHVVPALLMVHNTSAVLGKQLSRNLLIKFNIFLRIIDNPIYLFELTIVNRFFDIDWKCIEVSTVLLENLLELQYICRKTYCRLEFQ